MLLRPAALLALLGAAVLGVRAADQPYITYNALPLGSPEAPLLLRTYLPDPGLDAAVFANHFKTGRSPRYLPTRGEDVPGEYEPVKGLPAAIGVNHGPTLSYVFDTTEGRVLYAWQGGFVDMYPYWGDSPANGGRASNDYVPKLVGSLYYKAAGKHPVEVNGRSVSDLGAVRYVGYDLLNKQPVFIAKFGEQTIRTRVVPTKQPGTLHLELAAEPAAKLTYRTEDARNKVATEPGPNGTLKVTITGADFGTFSGYPRRLNISAATAEVGDTLAKNYGCIVCHTADGSPSHGPTWSGLYDKDRALTDGTSVKVDDAYLIDSIKNPNAKIVQGFAPNFMPPYAALREIEIQSLVLYIKSLKSPE